MTDVVDLGGLASSLCRARELGRVAILTTGGQGRFARGRFDLTAPAFLLSISAIDVDAIGAEVASLPLVGTIDLVMLDTNHTYEDSIGALEIALELLRPGGLVLCHDCLPLPQWISPEEQPGTWCGVTFAALRDLAAERRLPWFTINADLGIGVIVAGIEAADGGQHWNAWTRETHDGYVAEYERDPHAMMRVVEADNIDVALDLATAGLSLDEVISEFPGWDDPAAVAFEGNPTLDARAGALTTTSVLLAAHSRLTGQVQLLTARDALQSERLNRAEALLNDAGIELPD